MRLHRKKDMSAMDIMGMADELNRELSGAFVSKIFHRENDDVHIRFNTKNGRRDLLIRPGKWIFLAEEPGQNPTTASNLAMRLRKLINNAQVREVSQLGFERIVEIHLFRGEDYYLYAEFFSSGNLVLCDSSKNIRTVMRTGRWRDRSLRPGEIYRPPPSRIDSIEMDGERVMEIMRESSSDVVRTLITRFNLGPSFGEEVALRSGIEKSTAARDISMEDCQRISDSILGILDKIRRNREPNIVFDGEDMIDACPIELQRYGELRREPMKSFSAAIERYLAAMPEEVKTNPEVERIRRQIEAQKETLATYERQAELYKKMADQIYEQYTSFDRLINIIRQKWESLSIGEFRKWMARENIIKGLNPKEKAVDVEIGGQRYTIYFTHDLNYNTNLLYEKAKKLREKSVRGREAIKDSEKKLAAALKTDEQSRERKKEARREKRFWFEKYRWFLTSEGALAIGGRDARSNEEVVAKRMKQGDRYVHADIHGAPSVVVKMHEDCTEQSLMEAGQFSLCMSRAWAADIGSGSAYWVTPEQVSKTPQAGEFLPKGAFVIRGKRRYFNNLELKLAVGMILYEGIEKLLCAPVDSIKSYTERYVIIVPGKRKKEDVAKEIARLFDWPVDYLVSILPPGPSGILTRYGIEKSDS